MKRSYDQSTEYMLSKEMKQNRNAEYQYCHTTKISFLSELSED